MQAALSTDRSRFVRVIQAPGPLPINTWTHVAVVFDGRQGILYTNGHAVAVNHSVNLLPSDLAATTAYLGRSQYPADPSLNGRLDSIRLNSRPLSIIEVTAPLPIIVQPPAGSLYAGGDTIVFSGTATDYAGQVLSPVAFSWSAEFHHDGQADPVLGPIHGVTNGTFEVPIVGPVSTNVFYRITLSVNDSIGNQHVAVTDLLPILTSMELDTVPPGLKVALAGQLFGTPVSVPLVAGLTHALYAPSPQYQDGANHSFVFWSDGGSASHTITVPLSHAAYTASFQVPVIGVAATGSGLLLRWPDWAAPLELACTTNLAPPVMWQKVTNAPVISNDERSLLLPVGPDDRFFRLQPR
jgi:hypothetical protein